MFVTRKMMTKQEKEAIVKEILGDLVDTCESCERELGIWTENPFEADVRDVTIMEFLCKECYRDLQMEV